MNPMNPLTPGSETPGESPEVTQVRLTSYERYPDAQRAVDQLSDEGFPVEHVSIVWSRLRKVEYVTGRRTVAKAAGEGALSGLWFGAIIGVLLTLFVELDEDVSGLGVIVSYALTGAVVGAIFLAFGHWMRRGTRDFSTIGKLDAEAYELWVHPDHLYRARQMLGIVGD